MSSFFECPLDYDVVTVDQLQSLSHQNGLVGQRPARSGLAHPVADFDKNLNDALARLAIKKCKFIVFVRIGVIPIEARIVQSLEGTICAVADDDNMHSRISKFAARFFQKIVQPGVIDFSTERFLVGRVGVLGNPHQTLDFFPDVVFREHHDLYTTSTEKVNETVAQSSLAHSADASKNDMKKNDL